MRYLAKNWLSKNLNRDKDKSIFPATFSRNAETLWLPKKQLISSHVEALTLTGDILAAVWQNCAQPNENITEYFKRAVQPHLQGAIFASIYSDKVAALVKLKGMLSYNLRQQILAQTQNCNEVDLRDTLFLYSFPTTSRGLEMYIHSHLDARGVVVIG